MSLDTLVIVTGPLSCFMRSSNIPGVYVNVPFVRCSAAHTRWRRFPLVHGDGPSPLLWLRPGSPGGGGGGGGGPHQLRQRGPANYRRRRPLRRAGPPSAPVTAWGALAQRLHPRLPCGGPGFESRLLTVVVVRAPQAWSECVFYSAGGRRRRSSYLRHVVSFSDRGTSSC